MKTTQMRKNRGCLFQPCSSKGVSHHQLIQQSQRQACRRAALEWDRRENLRCALLGGCWHEETRGGLMRSGASWLILQDIFNFLQLILSGKGGGKRKTGSYWQNPDHSGPIAAEVWLHDDRSRGYGSEFCCLTWHCHYPMVYPVPQFFFTQFPPMLAQPEY